VSIPCNIFIKRRLNSHLMNRLDQHTQIMAEHLPQHLVELPGITLTPYRVSKFALDHAKGGLDV